MQEKSMDILLVIQKKSKGYKVYNMRIVETRNAWFIENGQISGSTVPWNVEIKEVNVKVPLTCESSNKLSVFLDVVPNNNEEEEHNNEPIIQNEPIVEEP